MTTDGASDFIEYVAALPAQHEIALMAENVSTAYYRARRTGWTQEQLVGDAIAALARGSVGLVVTRLNSLAESPPIKRTLTTVRGQQRSPLPECAECGIPYTRGSRIAPGTACVSCGEPLVIRYQGDV